MTRGREYTEEGLEIIMNYPQASDEELSQRPNRSGGEAGAVQKFMHNYHLGFDISGLSQMMIGRLQKGGWTCPRCGAWFPEGSDPRRRL